MRRPAVIVAISVVLAMTAVAPVPAAANDPSPTPYLWAADAPLTRNQTVSLTFIGNEAIAAEYVASNDPEVNASGILEHRAPVTNGGPWTLADGPDGPRRAYGQIRYTDGTWSDVLHLDFVLETDGASSLYLDLDPSAEHILLPADGDWHFRSRTPAEQFYGIGYPVDSLSPDSFEIHDGAWAVAFFGTTTRLTEGTYQIGSSFGARVRRLPWNGCAATGGTFTIHEIEWAVGDVQTADVDFRLLCGAQVMAGSLRYGSDRATVALDQTRDDLSFGQLEVGTTSGPEKVTFLNFGDVPVVLGSASVAGSGNFPAPDDYSIASDTCSGRTLALGDECSLEVRFTPAARGSRHARLSLPDTTPAGGRRVRLSGSGLQPTTLELAAPVLPSHAPGRAVFVLTITPPVEPFSHQPQLHIDGSQQSGPARVIHTDPLRESFTYEVNVGAGSHTATATFEGGFGYLASSAAPITFTVAGDATPPSGTISINNGAEYTNSQTVSVSVPATDAGTGLNGLALSNDGVNWVHQGYATPVAWTLPAGNGVKQVYVKWRDNAGNWSDVASDTIVLDETPPTVTVPVADFIEGSSINKGRVRLQVTWTGLDDGSGLAAHDLGQKTDTGSWSTVATTIPSATAERKLLPQHTYRFRARGRDNATNTSIWIAGAETRLVRLQEGSSRITYRGTWKAATSSVFWGGAAKKSGVSGSRASITFKGRSFAWVSRSGPDRGRAEILVNGVVVDTVDLYSPTFGNRRVVWAHSWATTEARTITVRVLATPGRPRVDIDAFITLD